MFSVQIEGFEIIVQKYMKKWRCSAHGSWFGYSTAITLVILITRVERSVTSSSGS